jgi:hypothetical protein
MTGEHPCAVRALRRSSESYALSASRQTYLFAFIDDACRLIPLSTFTFSEGAVAYLQVLEQAIRRRGIPKRLHVDNGSAFRSRALALVCAKLGIALIHAKPYTPQGKGKMERWFRTVRMQFLATLAPENRTSLEVMNRALAAWVEGEYHHAPHRGLQNETPVDKWARTSAGVRMPDANGGEMFLSEQRRRVQKDRTVTLDGVASEVDAPRAGFGSTETCSPQAAGPTIGHRHKRAIKPPKEQKQLRNIPLGFSNDVVSHLLNPIRRRPLNHDSKLGLRTTPANEYPPMSAKLLLSTTNRPLRERHLLQSLTVRELRADQNLRHPLDRSLRQLGHALLLPSRDRQHLQRRHQPIARRRVIQEDQMPALLSAEVQPIFAHRIDHVPIAHCAAQELALLTLDGPLQAQVGHHRGYQRAALQLARAQQTGGAQRPGRVHRR